MASLIVVPAVLVAQPVTITETAADFTLADGVLGEFAQADIVVKAGQPLDLGTLSWKPVRRGKPLWEVGVPNRTASEFAGAETFYDPLMPLRMTNRK